MRIGDLARRGGVSLPTVRYYLRAGLLPAGRATAANQAEYGDRHLHRLNVLFVLLDVGGMSVAGARAVLEAIEDSTVSPYGLLALAGRAGATSRLRVLAPADHQAVRDDLSGTLAAHGMSAGPDARPLDRLTDAYAAARRLGFAELEDALDRYAGAASRLVDWDVVVTEAIAARLAGPATGDRAGEVREALVVTAVLARVVQEALCDLAREQRLPGAISPRPMP
jgi:DNA-binding transcriptional MerR regulator